MTEERSEEALFHACLELQPNERSAYLARVCAGQPALHRRVERLLEAFRRAEGNTLDPLRGLLGDGPIGASSDASAAGDESRPPTPTEDSEANRLDHPSPIRPGLAISRELRSRGRRRGLALGAALAIVVVLTAAILYVRRAGQTSGRQVALAEELVLDLAGRARLELAAGRREEAERMAEEALELAIRKLGEAQPAIVVALTTRALVAASIGDVEDAMARAEEARRAAEGLYRQSPRHPAVLEARSLVGRALCNAGETKSGAARLERAVGDAAELPDDSGRLVGLLSAELARCQWQHGELAHALENSDRSLAALEEEVDPNALARASALHLRGQILLAARRPGEALPVLESAADLQEQGGATQALVAATRADHALALAWAGHLAEALDELTGLAARAPGSDSPAATRLPHVAGIVGRLVGDFPAALRQQQQWLASLPGGSAGARDRRQALGEIGLIQVELGQHADAITALLRALDLAEQQEVEMTPERADALLALGRARLALGRPAEARASLVVADRFWRTFAPQSRWAAEATAWLARCDATEAAGSQPHTSEASRRRRSSLSPGPAFRRGNSSSPGG